MLNKDFIEKIEEIVNANKTVEIGGFDYSINELKLIKDRLPDVIEVSSLESLKLMGFPVDTTWCHIVSSTRVEVIKRQRDRWGRSIKLAVADVQKYIPTFTSGNWYTIEDCIIKLNTCFQHDDNLKNVLNTISNIKMENNSDIEDDGLTQTVTAKSGVVLKSKIELPNPLVLKPIVTFAEIQPSEKEYIMRVRFVNNQVQVSIHEIQSRTWELEIMGKIRDYLKTGGYAVI